MRYSGRGLCAQIMTETSNTLFSPTLYGALPRHKCCFEEVTDARSCRGSSRLPRGLYSMAPPACHFGLTNAPLAVDLTFTRWCRAWPGQAALHRAVTSSLQAMISGSIDGRTCCSCGNLLSRLALARRVGARALARSVPEWQSTRRETLLDFPPEIRSLGFPPREQPQYRSPCLQ